MQDRGWSVADALERQRDEAAVAGAEVVVVNSRMAGRDLQQFYRVAETKLELVRNGVDLERFVPDTHGPSPLPGMDFVLFLGSAFRRKGLETAIQAVAALPGMVLAVAGQDGSERRWRAAAQKHGLKERFVMLGRVDRPELLLPHARALVLPTRYDSFANACLEALACGVPVVTTSRNGAAEVLPERWLVVPDPTDVAAHVRALEQALQTPGLRDRCRKAAEAHPADAAFRRLAALTEDLAR
jgi:UDP-glucose:(heptosyl)LPS alpha-1,3-glucosyltransferase